MLMTLTSVFVIVIFGYSNIYYLARDRHLELFNEATILCCIYHYYLFTDFVPDPEVRYTIGYSLIGFTFLNFVVNFIVMCYKTIVILIKKYKTFKYN